VTVKKYKKKLSMFLFFALYGLVILGMFFFAWNEQNVFRRGGKSPLYRNLRDCPAFVKRGFDTRELEKTPFEIYSEINAGKWAGFPSSGRRIKNSTLDLPKRTYLSPWGNEAEEFTLIIPVEIDSPALTFLKENTSALPGIYFAGIGENWEIFFNGNLILSEMHFNEKGQIKANRKWRDVYFPVERSLVVPGINILTLRIVGDPNYQGTGLFFTTAPVYMDNYWIINGRYNNDLIKILSGVFCIIGLYYMMMFFIVRRKGEIYNLYYGLFSILLCIFSISRNSWVHTFILNSNISIRLEFISCALMVLAFSMFIETLGRKKITKVTWGYAIFNLFFVLTQILFTAQYGEEMISIWNGIFPVYFTYILVYDIFYYFYWDKNGPRGKNTDRLSDLPIINILAASTLLMYVCAFIDVFVALFLKNSSNTFLYGTIVVQIGMAFALSLRFSGMHRRLEQSNVMLESAVHERTLELEKQTEIAVEASKTKSQFLATMSHEIRTPLNAIIGLSEIVLHRNRLLNESKSDLLQIHQSGMSLLGIINDVLDLSKIEARGLELIPSEYETAPFISETVCLNKVRIGSKPITFILEISDDFPRKLLGDELRVKQVLNNILSNAVKYTKEGFVSLTATWEYIPMTEEKETSLQNVFSRELKLSFMVRDTGIGIRRQNIGKLFSDYTQLDARVNRAIEGTGLGLVISKKLVEMMGGTITVESEYGKGSVFTVTLVQSLVDPRPIGKEIANDLKSFNYVSHVTEKNIEYVKMPYGKVLVVDDMPVNLRVAGGLLEPYGLRVDTAASGQEAIDKVQAAGIQYDIVFMDHMMPEMDGVEAVRIIRDWEAEKEHTNEETQIPIVALTANALAGNMEMFLSKGFNGFISKPIDIVQLDDALKKWVRDKHIPDSDREQSKKQNHNPQSAIHESHSRPPDIPGIDILNGIKMTGGSADVYNEILATFCEDVEERLPLLRTIPNESNLPGFTTMIHALKSASASIAAVKVSALAAELEAAGNKGNLTLIERQLPGFTEQLAELVKNIGAVL